LDLRAGPGSDRGARRAARTGERALLNLGTPSATALEAATGFSDRLFHARRSVGNGAGGGIFLSLGMIGEVDAARIKRHLAAVGLPTNLQDIRRLYPGRPADRRWLMA